MNTITQPTQTEHEDDGLCLCPSCFAPKPTRHIPEPADSVAAPSDDLGGASDPHGEEKAPEAAPDVEALTPLQRTSLESALRITRAGFTVRALGGEGRPLAEPCRTADEVRAAWVANPEARPGLEVGDGWAVVRLDGRTQPLYEASFGPLPGETVHWQGGGHRYWLLRVPNGQLPPMARAELDDAPVATSWSGREPWLYLGGVGSGAALRLPISPHDPDGFAWLNDRASAVPPLPTKLTGMLYELAYEEEVRRLAEYAERRDEEPMEPFLSPPSTGADAPRLLSSSELEQIVRGQELVPGLGMQAGNLDVLYGPSGAGKSFLALDLAFGVASAAGTWHGRQLESGAVVYVAAEGPETLTERRLAWQTHHEKIVGPGFIPYQLNGADLTSREGLSTLVRDLLGDLVRPRLIVVDTVSASIAGHEENSSSTMTALIRNARELARRFDACVLLVHHTGKDSSRGPRGHGSLFAAADTVMAVSSLAGGRVQLKVDKRRHGASGERVALRLVDVPLPSGSSCILELDEGNSAPASSQTVRGERASLVVETLTALGGASESKSALWQAMRERSGGTLGKDPALTMIAAAVDAGDAELVPDGRRTGVRLVA